ncbi:MAG: HAMP domain-containing histidine kinase [Solirubrobacterales bacterium]|nr:HAMP domain-containing histidine kinase [Solirubrobacterales bacterium]
MPLLSDERMTGVVRAARDDSAAQTDIRQAWVLLAAVGAAVVGLAALAAWVLGRRLAAPLERVAVVASRLGDGDFSARAPRASIEEVDKVGRALDSTAVRLHDLVMRERAFTADASHQLRTPLAALRIELEAMELRGAPAPEVGAALAQVDRLQTTIDTLLTVARDVPRPRERTDVVGLLDELENGWRGRLAAASRPLRVHAPGAPIEVRASRAVLVEILNVLMDNAWRHGRGAVVVRARCSGGYVAVEVGDEGPGFELDPEDAFERRRTQGPGHGIGLALARALAHAEGGRLDVPQPGPGPVVRLLVPVAISESWAPEDARSPSGRPGRED